MQNVNEIIAAGRIVNIGRNQYSHPAITIVVRGRRPAFIHFAFKDGWLDPDLAVGDSVRVKGHCKAYRYHNEVFDRMATIQYFIADEIERDETEMKKRFGIAGKFPEPSHCRAYFAGEVANKLDTKDPKWGKLTVKVEGQGNDPRPSYIQMSYYKDWNLPPFDYEKGDKVCVVASISTPQKELDGVKVNFENVVVEDIVKIKEEPAADADN